MSTLQRQFGLRHHRGGMTAKIFSLDDLKAAIEQACTRLLRYDNGEPHTGPSIRGFARVMFDVTEAVEPDVDPPVKLIVEPWDIPLEAERVNFFWADDARIAIYLVEGDY